MEDRLRRRIEEFEGDVGLIVKDLDTGYLIQINQDKTFPSASLVKIPILASCLLAANEGSINTGDLLSLKAKDKISGPGTLKDLAVGTNLSIEELMEFMITESDNISTNILIERLGLEHLNDCFRKLGLKDTNISRKMLDFKARKEGFENYTTASDTAYILEQIYRRKLVNRRSSIYCLNLLKRQKIRDRIPAKLPAGVRVAHKTGLERGICHDAGIVFLKNSDFIICVLTKFKNGNSKKSKALIADLALLAYVYFEQIT